jgi:hypothetical protein
MCRLSRNSGASTSWNPKGLSRPVAGKLYLLHLLISVSGWVNPRGYWMWTEGLCHSKISKNPTRNRGRDLSSCGAIPQPTFRLLVLTWISSSSSSSSDDYTGGWRLRYKELWFGPRQWQKTPLERVHAASPPPPAPCSVSTERYFSKDMAAVVWSSVLIPPPLHLCVHGACVENFTILLLFVIAFMGENKTMYVK